MLEEIKLLLGITDSGRDELLILIIKHTTARLKLLIGGMDPPEELAHIIVEVSVMRFNRIGSEGISGHTVEGESLQYTDDDFSAYAGEIQSYLRLQTEVSKGKVRFL